VPQIALVTVEFNSTTPPLPSTALPLLSDRWSASCKVEMGLLLLFPIFWAGFVGLVIFLHLLSVITPPKPSTMFAFCARSLTYLACILICATYGVFASIFLRIIGLPGLSQWTVARAFKWTMGLSTGVWFDVFEGAEYLDERPAVFLGNHQRWVLDYNSLDGQHVKCPRRGRCPFRCCRPRATEPRLTCTHLQRTRCPGAWSYVSKIL
jgi:hypothetical protein